MTVVLATRLGIRKASHRLADVVHAEVPAGDGTGLATTVWQPRDAAPGPTLLARTPYARRGALAIPLTVQARFFAVRGYRVVLQDVRGRFDSPGDFVPGVHEKADGAATIAWILAQSWSDGRVGVFGQSYLGGTAWAAAAGADDVAMLSAAVTHSAIGLPDERGVLHLDTTLRWLRSLQQMESLGNAPLTSLRQMIDARRSVDPAAAEIASLPLLDLDERITGESSAAWAAWATHRTTDAPFWAAADHRPFAASGRTPPTLHVTGWWDLFIERQIADWEAQTADRDPAADGHRLLVGPWTHLDPRAQVAASRRTLRFADRTGCPVPRPGWPGRHGHRRASPIATCTSATARCDPRRLLPAAARRRSPTTRPTPRPPSADG